MARKSIKTTGKTSSRSSQSRVTVDKGESSPGNTLLDKLQYDMQHNQSYLNLILGALIVIVLGVLIYNYFTKPEGNVGPSQQTTQDQSGDVAKENLPGKYTVKEGDTLFVIAEKYYNDGYKYSLITEANKLANENAIVAGQVLEIPKPSANPSTSPEVSASPSSQPVESPAASASSSPVEESGSMQNTTVNANDKGDSVGEDQSLWGDKITGDTYTVQPGDWLSKIAWRAYNDVYSYPKIAQANNLQNPDSIEVGQVLKIPR